MTRYYWIKFDNETPERWAVDNVDEFWYRLREAFLKKGRIVEWIIQD